MYKILQVIVLLVALQSCKKDPSEQIFISTNLESAIVKRGRQYCLIKSRTFQPILIDSGFVAHKNELDISHSSFWFGCFQDERKLYPHKIKITHKGNQVLLVSEDTCISNVLKKWDAVSFSYPYQCNSNWDSVKINFTNGEELQREYLTKLLSEVNKGKGNQGITIVNNNRVSSQSLLSLNEEIQLLLCSKIGQYESEQSSGFNAEITIYYKNEIIYKKSGNFSPFVFNNLVNRVL